MVLVAYVTQLTYASTSEWPMGLPCLPIGQFVKNETMPVRFTYVTLYAFFLIVLNVMLTFVIVSTAKEIRLRHAAPVVMMEVIDRMGRPLPAPLEVQHERARAPDMSGGHQVLVCSREQLKVCSSCCSGIGADST